MRVAGRIDSAMLPRLLALVQASDPDGGSPTTRTARRCRGISLRAYNIASGSPWTVGELATALAAAMSGPPLVVTGQVRAGDVRHVVASAARARRELDFTASVAFEEGVAAFARAPLRA